MHPTVNPRRSWHRALLIGLLAAGAAQRTVAQEPVAPPGPIARAEALLREGRIEEAEILLNRHVALQPNDGKAWLFLGRIYLDAARNWHNTGHPGATGPILLDFATQTIDQAHQLLTDSGSVFRVIVELERATNRIEEVGWERGIAVAVPPEDLPLPPVLREFGRNLIASCPERGVLLTGGLIETASAWGLRLLANVRPDLIILRPDLYASDQRYRAQMAQAIGADPDTELAEALVRAGESRPICLSPTLDSLAVEPLKWHPMRIVLVAGRLRDADNATPMSVFQLARTGLNGSVWSVPVRDLYQLAAQRNRSLCTSLFARPDAQGLPPIPACRQ
jgi:hypothetical protein